MGLNQTKLITWKQNSSLENKTHHVFTWWRCVKIGLLNFVVFRINSDFFARFAYFFVFKSIVMCVEPFWVILSRFVMFYIIFKRFNIFSLCRWKFNNFPIFHRAGETFHSLSQIQSIFIMHIQFFDVGCTYQLKILGLVQIKITWPLTSFLPLKYDFPLTSFLPWSLHCYKPEVLWAASFEKFWLGV